jgi:hypothetical protein
MSYLPFGEAPEKCKPRKPGNIHEKIRPAMATTEPNGSADDESKSAALLFPPCVVAAKIDFTGLIIACMCCASQKSTRRQHDVVWIASSPQHPCAPD